MQQTGQVSPDGKWLWNGIQWVPYQRSTSASPAQQYESAGQRARLVGAVLGANTVGAVLLSAYSVASDVVPGKLFDSQPAALTLLAVIAAVVWFVTLLLAVVVFCMWLHRVVSNMPSLGSIDPRWSPAGAVGRSFVPFLNFVHPLFGVLDAWRASDPRHRWLDVGARTAIPVPRLIVAWWLLWLAGIWGGNFADLTGTPGAVIDALKGAIYVAAAVLAILVVRQVTRRQERKEQLIATGQLV